MVREALATTKQPKIWINGEYIKPSKDSRGYFYIDENGKRVDLRKPLLSFEPFEGITKQIKGHIQKREEENKYLENVYIKQLTQDYETNQKKLAEYLASLGVDVKSKSCLTDAQESKISAFEYLMSKAHHSINRAKMTIRGNLLSNFMDACDLMKWA